jgi:hypothetical protein
MLQLVAKMLRKPYINLQIHEESCKHHVKICKTKKRLANILFDWLLMVVAWICQLIN